MKKIALTGGIGMGKSTAMWMFQEMGAETINADEIAHTLLEPKGAVWKALFERFGSHIMQQGGLIDRAALARIIFGDSDERKYVESVMHPRIHDEIVRLGTIAEKKGRQYVITEIPLLFETGWEKAFDSIIVVRCTHEQQLERCMAKFKLSRDEAEHRIKLQRPIEQKIAHANFVVDNDASREELKVLVHRLFTMFEKGEFKAK